MNDIQVNRNNDQDESAAELYQVAHMYYDLGMLQPEIAERMYFSRSKVSRMLKRAREAGIVKITVKQLFDRVPAVEKELCSRFGLENAIVITSYGDSNEDSFESLCEIGGNYVSSLLKGDCSLGIAHGKSVYGLIRSITKIYDCNLRVVQLMGASTGEFQSEESQNIMNLIARRFDGKSHYLNTPLYINDLYAKNILMQDETVRSAFQEMEKCDVVLSGIGVLDSMTSSRPNWHSYMTDRHREELHMKNAAGSMYGQYFNIDGELIPCEWNAKIMAAPLDRICQAKKSIGIAVGAEKAKAILGALRGGYMNVLMTDIYTVSKIMELNKL